MSAEVLPKEFGNGWMSRSAADLCRIAITIAGFDRAELIMTIHKIHRAKDRNVNAATVENAMQIISDTSRRGCFD